jgi:hypothetical protein
MLAASDAVEGQQMIEAKLFRVYSRAMALGVASLMLMWMLG